MIREEEDPEYDDEEIYYASYILPRPVDQEQEHIKANYDFTREILEFVQEFQKKEKNVDRLDDLKEDADGSVHLLDSLKEDTRSYIDFMSQLEAQFQYHSNWAENGKEITTWCSFGTCEHESTTYTFVDDNHVSWLEEILHNVWRN